MTNSLQTKLPSAAPEGWRLSASAGAGVFAVVSAVYLCMTTVQCASYDEGSDASLPYACNAGVECNYNVDFTHPPMHHRYFFFEYVCARDTPERVPAGAIPTEGCVLLVISDWHDQFSGCEGHCVESGWFCHHIDVERRVARVFRKYSYEENPFDYLPGEVLYNHPEVLVPTVGKRFVLADGDVLDYRNPPMELPKAIEVLSCANCRPGTFITLPFE